MKLLLLLLPCLHAFSIISPRPATFAAKSIVGGPTLSARAPPPVASESLVKPITARVAARPILVPALSYTGLAAVAVGASKAVEMAGYTGDAYSVFGVPLPLVSIAAVAAPAIIMLLELCLFGGGERVASMMGGVPADARLTDLASSVAQRAGLEPPAHVFEIPSDELNAFAAGFGSGDATVAVTTGLRKALSSRELEAVIAHEVGHIRHADMRTSMHVACAIAGLGGIYELGRVLVNYDSTRSSSSSNGDDDDEGGGTAALGLGLMAGGVAARCAAHLLQLSMSRGAEYDADRVAAELCGSEAMISALRKIQDVTDRKAEALREDREANGWRLGRKETSDKAPALASFRRGAFAHAYISSGETTTSTKEGGLGGWWKGVQTALSTHPTTESRIEALKEEHTKRSSAGRVRK